MSRTGTHLDASTARKDQIVRATIALLANRGYQATTFDAICQAAGLSSKRLITYHFSSKEQLFAAIADHVVIEAETFIRQALEPLTGAHDRLTTLIRANVMFMANHLEEMRALQQIILTNSHIWERHHTASVNQLADLLSDGQRTATLRPCHPQIMAAALRASIDSMYQPLAAGLDPHTCANELVELFDRGTRRP